MNAILVKDPIVVGNRLQELGIARNDILRVVEAMVTARNGSTENDPVGAPGLLSWIMGTRRLRDVFVPVGWEKDNSDQIPTILNSKVGMRIAVLNSDDGAGLDERIPQPRSKKGAATDSATSANQRVFSDILDESVNVIPMISGEQNGAILQWYLCVYSDGEITRAELSCPVGFANGTFTAFHERIFILTDGGDNSGALVRKITPDDDAAFDIPVIRKQAL